MPSAEYLKALAAEELVQLQQEGCEVGELQRSYEAALALEPGERHGALTCWFAEAAACQPVPGFPYLEPSDLAGIRAERAAGPGRTEAARHDAEDRIRGAWLGRCAGCMLGKPVEGWSRQDIRALLEHAGEYPLRDYFPPLQSAPPQGLRAYRSEGNDCLRGQITHGVRDDDTDYTILGLHVLEAHGPGFTSADVAEEWLSRLPYHRVYTAEREAYRNLVNGIEPPQSATVMNPYREWIGAQIRCDGFAYCAPGHPEKAAELAFRDAAVSHTRNGIYGEMFFAALIAAAMGTDDLHAAISAARAQIPDRSRLAEAVDDVVAWCAQDPDWETTWQRMDAKYGHYHPVHTINNAVIVLLACIHGLRECATAGWSDPLEAAVCIAVMGGLDTDCNGATAGSVVGALLGAGGVPDKWVAPLRDTLHSSLEGMNVNRISDLAQRTARMAQRVLAQ